MRSSLLRTASQHLRRRRDYSSSAAAQPERKVAILGAAGGIGQPLALLMMLNLLVSSLSLYDTAATPGVVADVSHINTQVLVKGFMGDDQLAEAMTGADVVIIPAGVPRKPGMTRDDLFKISSGIVKGLCTSIAKHCPNLCIAVDAGYSGAYISEVRTCEADPHIILGANTYTDIALIYTMNRTESYKTG